MNNKYVTSDAWPISLAFPLLLTPPEEITTMLRITTKTKQGHLTLSVEGRLAGPWVAALEQCWRELLAASPRQKFSINLCGVSFIDNAGKILLKEMYRLGGELIAEGCLNQAIVNEIVEADAKHDTDATKESDSRKKSAIIFYSVFFGLLLLPAGLLAQGSASQLPANPPSDTLRLTLEQSVALALKQNPAQQIAVLSAAESVQDKNITRSELLPQANMRLADSANRVNLKAQFGGESFPGLPFPGHLGPYQIFSVGPSLSSSILDLSLWKRYQASRSAVDASNANSLSTREQVILLVVSQYIGTLRADVELQNEKQRLIEAENDRDASLFGLSRLLNLDPRQKVELADSLSFFETPQPEVEASIDTALAGRQEWKAILAEEKVVRYQKQVSQFSRLPSLRFDGYWTELGTSANNAIPMYQYQASVNFPLFTSGRIHAETAKANLEVQKLDQQKADLRNQIALDVKTSLLNLASARTEVQVASLGVELAKEEVSQARDRFRAGVANNIE